MGALFIHSYAPSILSHAFENPKIFPYFEAPSGRPGFKFCRDARKHVLVVFSVNTAALHALHFCWYTLLWQKIPSDSFTRAFQNARSLEAGLQITSHGLTLLCRLTLRPWVEEKSWIATHYRSDAPLTCKTDVRRACKASSLHDRHTLAHVTTFASICWYVTIMYPNPSSTTLLRLLPCYHLRTEVRSVRTRESRPWAHTCSRVTDPDTFNRTVLDGLLARFVSQLHVHLHFCFLFWVILQVCYSDLRSGMNYDNLILCVSARPVRHMPTLCVRLSSSSPVCLVMFLQWVVPLPWQT